MPEQDAHPDLRYEIKMVCDRPWLAQARSWIRLHPAGFRVAYPPRFVSNLYLDTPHLSSLNENLEGLSARQKLRLRWYGTEVTDVEALLELKQKRNLLGSKRQCLLPCRLDLRLPWAETLSVVRASVPLEWRILLQAADRPTVLNRYLREYYVTPDGGVRVTLDSDQVACDQRLVPRPAAGVRLPIADTVVLEVKASAEHAERVEEVVAQFPLPRSRNSKYVRSLLVALG